MSKMSKINVTTLSKPVQVGDKTESDPEKMIHHEEQTDFNVIKINEEADLKGNIKVQSIKNNLIPTYGPKSLFFPDAQSRHCFLHAILGGLPRLPQD